MTLFSCSCSLPGSRPVQPDVQENRFRILVDAYESFNRGDMAAAVAAMDPNVEWIEPAEFPGGDRPYRGPKDVMVYLANSRAGWEHGRSDPERLIPAGDKVVVFVHARFRRRGSAERMWPESRPGHHWRKAAWQFRSTARPRPRRADQRHWACQTMKCPGIVAESDGRASGFWLGGSNATRD